MLDPTDPRYEVAPLEEFVDVVEEAVEQAPVIEDLDLDLGEVDLGSLLVQSQSEDDTGPSDRPDTAGTDTEADETPDRPADAAPPTSLALSDLGARGASWELVEAVQDALATREVDDVVADVGGLEAESEVGVSYRELIADVASEAGATVRETDPMPEEATDESSPSHEPANPPPDGAATADNDPGKTQAAGAGEDGVDDDPHTPGTESDDTPVPDPDQGLEDDFDFDFQAPPVVRGGL